MQWDDLRYVLAVHRTGSVAGAARALNVSNVTVFRRIEAIEETLGVRLFDRKRKGYVATAAAAEIVEQAAQIEEQVRALEHRVWKQDSRAQGTIRLTITDTYSSTIIPGMLAKLRKQYPQISIELLVNSDLLNLMKRDADIAVRATSSPPETLVGHHIAPLRSAVFASKTFAARHLRGPKKDLSKVPWVTLSESFSGHRISQWIRKQGYDRNAAVLTNSFLGVAHAVRGGLGVGVMSTSFARIFGGVVRVSPVVPELDTDIWILTHPDLRDVARVSAVYNFLRGELGKLLERANAET